MQRLSVDPSLHPVEQYRSAWIDIVQYLALLYIFSKFEHYQAAGKDARFSSMMMRYRDLNSYSQDFEAMVEAIADPGEYAQIRGFMDTAHTSILSKNYRSMPVKRIFTLLRDDVHEVHVPKIRAVLRPLSVYFREGSVPNEGVEIVALAAMSRIRNPRLRRILAMVQEDLASMAAAVVEPEPFVATKDDILGLSKAARMGLVRDTNDDSTLEALLEVAAGGDRSVLAALFQRGYIKGNAVRLYADNKLVTIGNFKRLTDDVLELYIRKLSEGSGQFYKWEEKFSGRSRWEYLWEQLTPGRPDWTIKMVRNPVKGISSRRYYGRNRNSGARSEGALYRLAADDVDPRRWLQEDILLLWSYATDPRELISHLDKPTRLSMYPNLTSNDRNAESIWLFDATRVDVEPFYKAGKLTSSAFINQVFGAPWGKMTVAAQNGNWRRVSDTRIKKFLEGLTKADVLLLNEAPFRQAFGRAIINGDLGSRHPGGVTGFVGDLWEISPEHVRIWLVSFLPSRLTTALVSGADDDLAAKYTAMEAARRDASNKAAQAILDKAGGKVSGLGTQTITDYATALDPHARLDFYIRERAAGNKVYMGDIEELLGKTCPPNRTAEFLAWYPAWSSDSWDSQRIVDRLIPKLRPADAIMLVGIDHPDVRSWVVSNISIDHVREAAENDSWILRHLCSVKGTFTQADVSRLIDMVGSAGMDTEKENENLACLVRQLEDPSKYLNHASGTVRSAALMKAPVADVVSKLRSSDEPLIEHLFERDDAAEHSAAFIDAYLNNYIVADPSGMPGSEWRKALSGFDKAVRHMTDAQFAAAIEALYKVQDMARMRRAKPFGIYTAWRATVKPDPSYQFHVWKQMRINTEVMFDMTFSELHFNFPIEDIAKLSVNSDTEVMVQHVYDAYRRHPAWMAEQTTSYLEKVSKRIGYGNYQARAAYDEEIARRKQAEKDAARGEVDGTLSLAYEANDAGAYAALLNATYETNRSIGSALVYTVLNSRDITPGFKASVIGQFSPKILDTMWTGEPVLKLGAVQYSSPRVFSERMPELIEKMTEENEEEPEYHKRNTRMKAAMISRCTAAEAMTLFQYYYKVQGRFGPKVREAFLEKLDESMFADLLTGYLLGKAFTLRKKVFTLEMVPLVIKLDNSEVTDKFNRSSRFRAKKIGSASDAWDALPDDGAKAKWLDDVSDAGIMESLLKTLIERTVSLRAPLDEEFTIGTNNAVATSPLLAKIQMTSRTTTHAELFNLAMERASEAELRGWLLGDPLEVFNLTRAAPTDFKVRIDAVPQEEEDRVAKILTDMWKGASRAIRPEVKGVFKVTNPNQDKWEDRKDKSSNVMTLLHGTHFFVAGLVIQNHFKVMKSAKAGRMMGDGIYFTDVGSKCAQYITTNAPSRNTAEGVILVCEVDLGNKLELNSDNDHLRHNGWQPLGYDSIYWPKRGVNGGSYGGRDSEYAVSDVSRIRVTHAIYLKRVNDSNW